MRSNDSTLSRRRFLTWLSAAAGAAMLAPFARFARAEDLPHLAESDPTATALSYREDATQVDAAKFPQKKAGAVCGNCQFYYGGDGYGPCQLFPGKAVNAKGWCSAHSPKS